MGWLNVLAGVDRFKTDHSTQLWFTAAAFTSRKAFGIFGVQRAARSAGIYNVYWLAKGIKNYGKAESNLAAGIVQYVEPNDPGDTVSNVNFGRSLTARALREYVF